MKKNKRSTPTQQSSVGNRLNIAKDILNNVRTTVISTHDIISSLELTPAHAARYEECIRKYGQDRWSLFLDCANLLKNVRKYTREHITTNKIQPSPYASGNISIQMLGIGECAELSDTVFLFCTLTFLGDENVTTVMLSKKDDIHTNHAIVVIGNCETLSPKQSYSVQNKNLGEDVVIIDPLLKLAFHADQPPELYTQYIEKYGINWIYQLTKSSASQTFADNCRQVLTNANIIHKHLDEKFGTQINKLKERFNKLPPQKSEVSPASTLFSYNSSPRLAQLVSLTEKVVPNPAWKFDKNKSKFWLKSTKENIEKVCDDFLKKGFNSENLSVRKIKDGAEHVLLIDMTIMEAFLKPIQFESTNQPANMSIT